MLNRRELLGTLAGGAAAVATGVELMAEDKVSPDGQPHFRAKEILGSQVRIDGDTEVGTVDDIVLDQDGNVDYLIVVNDDNRFVTIPWDAAQFNAEKRLAVVHIAPEKYREIPVYTPERYPVFSTPAYRLKTYQYFGLTPAQERRLIRRAVRNR